VEEYFALMGSENLTMFIAARLSTLA